MKCEACALRPARYVDQDYGTKVCRPCMCDLLEQKIEDVMAKAYIETKIMRDQLKRLRAYDRRGKKARTVEEQP